MSRLPLGYVVRLAIITSNESYTTEVECLYTDSMGEHKVRCTKPYPYAGNGGGIFVGFEKGTRVLIAMGPQEQAYIVGLVPNREYYFSQGGVSDSPLTSSSYPKMAPGEICLKGPTGSRLDLYKNGNISIEASTGNLEADFELSTLSRGLFLRTDNTYKFTEAGREIEGIIRRDKNDTEDQGTTNTINFLSGESYDRILDSIGRSSDFEVGLRSTQISKLTIRNPALIEKRSIVYECADSFAVRGLSYESKAMMNVDEKNVQDNLNSLVSNPSSRENRRTDILNLNPYNFNHLIEKVEGTVVDIYGNILDINRNKIKIPSGLSGSENSASESLLEMYAYLRRSVKYHFEINSRKEIRSDIPPIINTLNNATEHSRWSIDVDGEGLTKINIPASSETGNIPLLGRYVVSRDPNKIDAGQFKDTEKQDVRLLPFGNWENGQKIVSEEYKPAIATDNTVKVQTIGSAHHNLMNIASSVFNSGKLGISNSKPMVEQINNKILGLQNNKYTVNPDANAGGKSININLDGGAEVSVGADTADRKSLTLDLAGGVVSHYGRDRNGRSLIHQTDGDVIIQIGGKGIADDERFDSDTDVEDRPGRIEIHLARPGKSSQKIIIDESGMTFEIFGSTLIKASEDLTLSAGANLLLHGETVHIYGNADTKIDGTREFQNSEIKIDRKGRII